MKKFVTGVAAFGLAASIGSVASAETTLRAIGFIPKNHPVMAMARKWVDDVNAAVKGKLKINYVGGPEVITRYQQIDALKNGVIDIVFMVTADIQDKLPSTSAMTLSKCSPEQERKSGFYALMASELAKQNIMYVGRVQRGNFYQWINKDAKNLDDLKGLKMRTGSLFDKFMRAFGMVPVTINSPEVYTALERGVVDGFGWPVLGPRQRGWLKKVKYVIDIPFFGNSNMIAGVNMDKWKALPADVQKKVMDVTIGYEPQMTAYFNKLETEEWKKIGNTVKKIKFSPADNKKYIDTIYGVEWDAIAKRVSPEMLAKLKSTSCN